MADILIWVEYIPGMNDDVSLFAGQCWVSPGSAAIPWEAEAPANALAATVNANIKAAAIAAAEAADYTIGALDKKTVIGAAVGL